MRAAQALVAFSILLILGVPLAVRSGSSRRQAPGGARTLIVVTPHVQQIRVEFAEAFDRWHRREYGEPVRIDYRQPGGTSEIVRQLQAQFNAAIRAGRISPDGSCDPGTIGYDVMLGGGSYDHTRLKRGDGVRAVPPGSAEAITVAMSVPAGFSQEQLDRWYGANRIGAARLYDPDQYWLGTALSSFGIVYNRELVERMGLPEPRQFGDLTRPEYAGWVALCDPRQSGSITTTFDSILNNFGWERGWRLLREMTANTRYFTNSSTKPPIDVSLGEAAAGLAIDFYGRGQAQSVLAPGQQPGQGRVGYVDPKGTVFIDPDPVSIIRGGPHPELARRFVRFCLTEEAQAVWQFPARDRPESADNPTGPDGQPMGPMHNELRRMPVRRVMYEKYLDHFVDKVDPFAIASPVQSRGWRSSIGIMMGAFAIDSAKEQRQAWRALTRARQDPDFDPDVLAQMERLFYAFPPCRDAEGRTLEFTEQNYRAIRGAWRDPDLKERAAIQYSIFFRANYRRVVELARRTDTG